MNMPKLTKSPIFFKVFIPLLDAGLDWHQAGVLFYIQRLTDKNFPCFASAETIGAELRIPYGTVRRVIDSLILKKYLLSSRQGRKRILKLSPLYYAAFNSVQNEQHRNPITAQNEHLDTAQNEQLPRYITPRYIDLDLNYINNNNLNNNNINLGNINLGNDIGENMKGETEAEKTRRLHLKDLWDDPTGWKDIGHALTKWDEVTNTLLRKVKPVHQDSGWHGRIDYGDLPE